MARGGRRFAKKKRSRITRSRIRELHRKIGREDHRCIVDELIEAARDLLRKVRRYERLPAPRRALEQNAMAECRGAVLQGVAFGPLQLVINKADDVLDRHGDWPAVAAQDTGPYRPIVTL